MADIIPHLYSKGLIKPPPFLPHNIHYVSVMGSQAYLVSDDASDMDLYGFCMPPKSILFPHLAGYIPGFDMQIPKFESFQAHHILDPDTNKTYDLNIFSIVTYFRLCADCNPNMIDSLFTKPQFLLTLSPIGRMVLENRQLFLCQKLWHTFKGYSHQQLKKMNSPSETKNPKRLASVQAYGYDVKYAYHLVRLLLECIDLLSSGDIHWEKNAPELKEIRAGRYTKEEVVQRSEDLMKQCEVEAARTQLPNRIRENDIKTLLIDCLEHHYGSLKGIVSDPTEDRILLDQIRDLLK